MDMQNVVNTVKYYLAVKIFLNNVYLESVLFKKVVKKDNIFLYAEPSL